jgi:hypothetical protein
VVSSDRLLVAAKSDSAPVQLAGRVHDAPAFDEISNVVVPGH